MKIPSSSVILLGFFLAIPYAQAFTCPEDDCVISQCLYPNPNNCTTFWQCSNGEPFLKDCPGGLEYNDFIKVCDWPSSQTCIPGLQPTPKPTTTSTTAAPTTSPSTAKPTTRPSTARPTTRPSTAAPTTRPTTAKPTTRPSTARPTTRPSTAAPTTSSSTTAKPSSPSGGDGPDFECPVEDIADTACNTSKACLYPNPDDCNSYIQCTVNADNKTGTPVVRPCAPADPPLEWNDDEKECDYPELSTCPNKTPSPPADTTTASSEETTVIPDDSDFTTTTEQPPSEGQTTPSEEPVETTTAEEEDNSPTTAEPLPPCGGDDTDTDDADLDLTSLCGTGCSAPRAIRNPNSDQRYVVCNGGENNDQNSVRKCGLGLVFDNSRLTCNYPGLVDKSI